MKIRTLINDGEGRFFEYEPNDLLRLGPVLEIDAPDVTSALNRAYAIGNREGADDDGVAWPSDVRSLSVGDVLVVPFDNRDTSHDTVPYTVERVGFTAIDPSVALYGLAFGQPNSRGLGSFRSDLPVKETA